jgi:hypothetical protein
MKPTLSLQRTFPDSCNTPSVSKQSRSDSVVTFLICVDLGFPKFGSCSGKPEKVTIMPMPEATVHKDDRVKPAEDDVGLASKVFSSDPEAITQFVQTAPYQKFRLCVLSPDCRHITAPGHGIVNVRHTLGQRPHH